MSREINPYGLRMPPELREKLEAAARQSARSLNAEIVRRLEESLEPWPRAGQASDDFQKFLQDAADDREFYADLGQALAEHMRDIAERRKTAVAQVEELARAKK